jgi:CDP-glycerol glycerophosphotransferase (TagB/SpsB family)
MFTKAITQLARTCLLLCASLFLSLFFTRKKNKILVFSRDRGKLLDNCKYIFPTLQEQLSPKATTIFVTQEIDVYNKIMIMGYPCHLNKRGITDFIFFMTAGIIIVDSIDWGKEGWHIAFRGAKIIQLWHGIPLKEIEQKKAERHISDYPILIKLAIRKYWAITQRFPCFDALVATSKCAAHLLSICISSKECWITGYPRNDILFKKGFTNYDSLNVDGFIYSHVLKSKNLGRKIIFYCPTFRDGMKNPIKENQKMLFFIDRYLAKNNMSLYIKLHPWIKDTQLSKIENVKIVESESDIYPLLPHVDILITDYSSIYFDFLLLDKPIIFFAYDIENYKLNDRSLLLDYDQYTPGKKVFSLKYLIRVILEQLKEDSYIEARSNIKKLMFDELDDKSSLRIAKLIDEKFL